MATVRPDHAPVTVACWYEYRSGGRVLLSMSDTARRLDHLRRNPNVALTILGDDWYQHVSLLGRVIETRRTRTSSTVTDSRCATRGLLTQTVTLRSVWW